MSDDTAVAADLLEGAGMSRLMLAARIFIANTYDDAVRAESAVVEGKWWGPDEVLQTQRMFEWRAKGSFRLADIFLAEVAVQTKPKDP